jgi:hypothetical protein
MDFDTLKNKYLWKEIYGCPGRFILKNEDKKLTVEELLKEDLTVNSFKTEKTTDEVLIVRFKGGGLISYKKPDNTCTHTLNNEEGFIKKLKMLEINPENIK